MSLVTFGKKRDEKNKVKLRTKRNNDGNKEQTPRGSVLFILHFLIFRTFFDGTQRYADDFDVIFRLLARGKMRFSLVFLNAKSKSDFVSRMLLCEQCDGEIRKK